MSLKEELEDSSTDEELLFSDEELINVSDDELELAKEELDFTLEELSSMSYFASPRRGWGATPSSRHADKRKALTKRKTQMQKCGKSLWSILALRVSFNSRFTGTGILLEPFSCIFHGMRFRANVTIDLWHLRVDNLKGGVET